MTANDEPDMANPSGPVHGQLSYLQVPARDVGQSATFYAKIFGWHVEQPHPSFEAPGLIGQWVTDRPAAPDAGLLVWIQVDSIDDTLELVRTNGGEVVEPPSADGDERWLGTIRDPAGNVLGIVQNRPH
jgi:predicted enzyme related to lactoylglutathione lyase